MSAELELLPHWKACVDTANEACVLAFTDHLIELWDRACADDGQFAAETGCYMPVLSLEHSAGFEVTRLKVDHSVLHQCDIDGNLVDDTPRVDIEMSKSCPLRAGPPYNVRRKMVGWVSPSLWGHEHPQMFVSAVMEFLVACQHKS